MPMNRQSKPFFFNLQASTKDYYQQFAPMFKTQVEVRQVPSMPYYVTSDGRVINAKDYPMFCTVTKGDTANLYDQVTLSHDGKDYTVGIHRLVALCWLGPKPDKQVVCHLNSDHKDNRICNLAYVPNWVNMIHKIINGKGGSYLMTQEQLLKVAKLKHEKQDCDAIFKAYIKSYGTADRFGNVLTLNRFKSIWRNPRQHAQLILAVEHEQTVRGVSKLFSPKAENMSKVARLQKIEQVSTPLF